MHETVSLPGSHHFRVTLGNVKEERFSPRFALRNVQLEDMVRNPFAQDTKAVPMGFLLAHAAKSKGGTVEGLEAAYADEGWSDAGENTGVLQFLAWDGQIGQRYEGEGASGWDGEGVHGYGVLSTLRARYSTKLSPSEQRNSRIDERRTARPSAARAKGVRPDPLSCSS